MKPMLASLLAVVVLSGCGARAVVIPDTPKHNSGYTIVVDKPYAFSTRRHSLHLDMGYCDRASNSGYTIAASHITKLFSDPGPLPSEQSLTGIRGFVGLNTMTNEVTIQLYKENEWGYASTFFINGTYSYAEGQNP